MKGLRVTKKLLSYLIIVCCGVLIIFMYVYRDWEKMSTWTRASEQNDIKQLSILKENKNSTKVDTDSLTFLSSLKKSQESVTDNSSQIIEPDIAAKFTNEDIPSSQQELMTEKPNSQDSHSRNFRNFSNEKTLTTFTWLRHDNGTVHNGGNTSWMTQTLENNFQTGNNLSTYTNVILLSDIFHKKMSEINIRKIKQFKPTCENDFKRANSCNNKTCLQTELPENLTTRIEQLVVPPRLQMSPEEHEILRKMADEVAGSYEIILLTAASSNHFLESQALLKNLHENVYPYLKNFTLIFYNLGLKEHERALLVKYCKCQVKDFPFDKFPQFMTLLKCYTWKPVMIKAHLQKANILFWMDASIRFHNSSTNLSQFIQITRERGVQIIGTSADTTFRTHQSMYHFFGDEACAYLTLGQGESGFEIYHREYFVDRVILEPWVACALDNDCMCLKDRASIDCRNSIKMAQRYYKGKQDIVYGLCHRYDQSALSVILHKLYQDYYQWVMVDINSIVRIHRMHKVAYFPEQ